MIELLTQKEQVQLIKLPLFQFSGIANFYFLGINKNDSQIIDQKTTVQPRKLIVTKHLSHADLRLLTFAAH